MSYEMMSETVRLAVLAVSISGVTASALAEMVKQIVQCVSNYRVMVPARYMTLGSSVVSVAMSSYMLMHSGIGGIPAVMASIVAVFTPKLTHDLIRRNT